ncbi:hypothetical protein V8E36_003473 [Tilletia maclaganii]
MASRMRSASSWQNDRFEEPAYPPPQFSIRGTSGPYWLLISNLMKGTSAEDIRMTFEPFGSILTVNMRNPPTSNHPSSAFEIAFESRVDASRAREQFNGALADGRVLSVDFLPGPSTPAGPAGAAGGATAAATQAPSHQPTGTTESSVPYAQFSRSVSQAAQDRKTGPNGEMLPGPAPLPRDARSVPTGPAASQGNSGRRELLGPRGSGSGGHGPAPPTGPRAVSGQKRKVSGGDGRGPSNVAASAPTPAKARSLQSRLMGPAEAARAQKAQTAAKKAAAAARGPYNGTHGGQSLGALGLAARRSGGAIPTGPKGGVLPAVLVPPGVGGKGKKGGAAAPVSLKDRIGSLPLALRLAAADSKANKGPKSDVSQVAAAQKSQARKRKSGGAKGGSSMDLD